MTSSTTVSPGVIDLRTSTWCLARLKSENDGTLTYRTPRGRVQLRVRYTVIDDEIAVTLPTLDSDELVGAGGTAVLIATGPLSPDGRWVVRATGTVGGRTGQDQGPAQARAAHPSSGNLQPAADQLTLTSVRIRGFSEIDAGG